MVREQRKRPARVPLTQEELAQVIAYKKIREARRLQRFRRSAIYKIFNVFNIACFFMYWELLFCFLGPCHYQTHYSRSVRTYHGDDFLRGRRVTTELDLVGVSGREYKFLVNDFIETPPRFAAFRVGSDYLLQKELKGVVNSGGTPYYIQSAGSVLFLSILLIIISFTSFIYNLNEQAYSLNAVTALNALILVGLVLI